MTIERYCFNLIIHRRHRSKGLRERERMEKRGPLTSPSSPLVTMKSSVTLRAVTAPLWTLESDVTYSPLRDKDQIEVQNEKRGGRGPGFGPWERLGLFDEVPKKDIAAVVAGSDQRGRHFHRRNHTSTSNKRE